MTVYEHIIKLNDPQEAAECICRQMEHRGVDCDACPFSEDCWEGHNGLARILKGELRHNWKD